MTGRTNSITANSHAGRRDAGTLRATWDRAERRVRDSRGQALWHIRSHRPQQIQVHAAEVQEKKGGKRPLQTGHSR